MASRTGLIPAVQVNKKVVTSSSTRTTVTTTTNSTKTNKSRPTARPTTSSTLLSKTRTSEASKQQQRFDQRRDKTKCSQHRFGGTCGTVQHERQQASQAQQATQQPKPKQTLVQQQTSTSSKSKVAKFTSMQEKGRPSLLNRRSMPGALDKDRRSFSANLSSNVQKHRYSTPGKKISPVRNKPKESPKRSILKKPATEITDCQQTSTASTSQSRHVTFKSKATDQASLRAKLNAWLEAKGKTPSKCRHLICFDAEMSEKKKKVKLVDRTLTNNLLEKQNETLEKEDANARKKLFHINEVRCSGTTEGPVKENIEPEAVMESNSQVQVPRKGILRKSPAASNSSLAALSPAPRVSSPIVQDNASDVAVCKQIKAMLEECLFLFDSGSPQVTIMQWLDEMETNIARTLTFAPYYICKARVLSGSPERMLEVLCQAVRNKAEPSHVLATEMFNLLHPIVTRANQGVDTTFATNDPPQSMSPSEPNLVNQTPMVEANETESPEQPVVGDSGEQNQEMDIDSTPESTPGSGHVETSPSDKKQGRVLRYSISSTTPLVSRPEETGTPLAVVTPVRRSLRLSNRQATPMRREVESLSELTDVERDHMLYKENVAMGDTD